MTHITVYTTSGPLKVPARLVLMCGLPGFALHRSISALGSSSWTVTHVESGRAVADAVTHREVIAASERVLWDQARLRDISVCELLQLPKPLEQLRPKKEPRCQTPNH